MKREEQLKFCKVCKKQKFDTIQGVICSLTGAQTDFEESCEHYETDEDKKLEMMQKDEGNEINNSLASSWRRFANYLLDAVFYFIFIFIIMIILALVSPNVLLAMADNTMFNYSITFSVFLLYYIILEYTMGRTFGKMITGTYVVDENGNTPSFKTILTRTICRFIPFEAFSFLGSEGSGWHDTISKTHVIVKK